MAGGLVVKMLMIANASVADWEIAALPPISIFTVASVIFPFYLALAFSRTVRQGRILILVVECVLGAYSLIATFNHLNVAMLLNLVLAAVIVVLTARRRESDIGSPNH
ncbi:hypothetical protein [Nonomuraea maritima]|nr:hypothetical protein [Nonomuraea maritima]